MKFLKSTWCYLNPSKFLLFSAQKKALQKQTEHSDRDFHVTTVSITGKTLEGNRSVNDGAGYKLRNEVSYRAEYHILLKERHLQRSACNKKRKHTVLPNGKGRFGHGRCSAYFEECIRRNNKTWTQIKKKQHNVVFVPERTSIACWTES